MFRMQRGVVLSLGIFLFCLMPGSYTLAAMKIQLKDGTVVEVPVNKEDIVSLTFEEKAQGRLLEMLTIPNNKPVKVSTTNVLENGRWYVIEASGVISDWDTVKDGVDAVWCYAEWRCGKQGQLWNQLRIDEKGMPDIAGQPIPYNPQHTYQVRYLGQGKKIEFYALDAQGSWSDNSGAFTVKILQE